MTGKATIARRMAEPLTSRPPGPPRPASRKELRIQKTKTVQPSQQQHRNDSKALHPCDRNKIIAEGRHFGSLCWRVPICASVRLLFNPNANGVGATWNNDYVRAHAAGVAVLDLQVDIRAK